MSQIITRKKRFESSQSLNNAPTTEGSNISNYFKDCLTFVSDGFENQLPKKSEETELKNAVIPRITKTVVNSRPVGIKSKNFTLDSLIPPKKGKTTLTENINNTDTSSGNKNISHKITPAGLSIIESQKSLTSFKYNKSNVFDNITESFTGSKILSCQLLNDVNSQKRFELSSWGLPPLILEKYQARGINTMFLWQVECLANRKILEEYRNLVYSAPTSAGKTLVAEFLVLKTVLERRKKAIFILPFVSVVREKMFYFQDLLSDSGVRVEGFMGGVSPAGGFSSVHIAIATIEKANSLINRLMEDGDLITLGAVVIDELHLLGDPGRGYLLELLLTKLRYMTLSVEQIEIQLIGMSATLPNLPLIAEWLDAELYKTDFRPIPLKEQYKFGSSLFDSKLNVVRKLEAAPDIINDTDNIIQLCIETINGGHGVLIFCPTKNWCEKLASQTANIFFQLGRDNTTHGKILRENIDLTAVQEVLVQLQHCPVGLDSVLKMTVSFGVAFHHAGLTMDERDIIEGGFRVGSIKVLVATSTLSSGVNLPARRVIIRTPMFNGRLLDKLTYQQMIGRAGRMGKDTEGESILICKQNDRATATNLLKSSLEPIESCLEDSGPLIRALLEAIASEIVRTPNDLDFYSKCTFVYKCDKSEVKTMVNEAVKFLISNEFLCLKDGDNNQQRMLATCLGKACLAASIPPREALFLFEELQRARKCFVLDTELHVIYLVTPFNAGNQIGHIDWMIFLELWKSLPESERRVGQLVGVEERFLISAVRGIVKPGKALNIHRRFYTALALYDLVREVPLRNVCLKYNCCRGLLQSLQQSSSTFAGMVTNFCKELKWDCMELLFAQFQARLQFGVCRDLLDLLRLPSLNGLRARSLFKHGITTVTELAVASEIEVEEALNKALPFESEKDFDGENEAEIAKRTKMRTVFITGKDGLTAREAAFIVIKEARMLVKNELGVQDVQWNQSNNKTSQPNLHLSIDNPTSLRPTSISEESVQSRITADLKCTVEDVSKSKGTDVKSMDNIQDKTSPNTVDAKNEYVPKTGENRVDIITPKITENENQDSITSENLSLFSKDIINENNRQEMPSKTLRSSSPEKSSIIIMETVPEDQKCISDNSKKFSEPSENVIPESNKLQITTRALRSKLADITKNALKEDRTIHSADIENKFDSYVEDPINNKQKSLNKSENKLNSIQPEFFQFSDYSRDEMKQVVERSQKNAQCILTSFINVKANEQNKRSSGGSNSSKSLSLFSDSSFLDAQVCSILEKNVIDVSCLADFEKSTFTSHRESAAENCEVDNEKNVQNEASKMQRSKDSQKNLSRQASVPMTWTQDSWDQSKKISVDKENKPPENNTNDPESPSLLQKPKTRARLKTLVSTHKALSKIQATSSRKKKIPSQSIETSNSIILRKQSLDKKNDQRSPVAGIRTYNTRGPFLCSTRGFNQSDSDESIVSSQTASGRQAMANKTRRKIEEKLLKTQQLGQSTRIKDITRKVICTVSPKLLETNTEPIFKDASDDADDSSGSCLIFDSDDTGKSQTKKVLKADNCMTSITSNDRIDLKMIKAVNVANSKRIFREFRSKIEGSAESERRYDLAVAIVTEYFVREPATAIGNKIVGIEEKKKRDKKNDAYIFGNKKMCGIVISWDVGEIYYMPFSNTQETKITIKERLSFLRNLVTDPAVTLRCFNAKDVYKMLYFRCENEPFCKFLDPKTGDWLLNSDNCNKTYSELAAEYFPKGLDVANAIDNSFGGNTMTRSTRAFAKALLAWYITEPILNVLEQKNPILFAAYKEIEMPTIISLANMELRGFGINIAALQELSGVIKNDLLRIEEKAFSLAGRKFNFYSSKEVSQVLGLNKKGRICTNKNALRSCENPISDLVTLWRKLNTVQTKIVFPLLQVEIRNQRIHGNCITYTVTGRVSMHEPNLQTIPRDFTSEISNCILSVRMAFIPTDGNVLLSADFCQLELRILAHFSQDAVLCKLLHEEGDIFKSIAARLHNTTEEMVTDDMRQRAKQLCYAMIYGMGIKSLADNLSVTESEAKDYLEAFMGTYKGIRVWLKNATDEVRAKGFVSTLIGRRRILPSINSKTLAIKAQAERQAVNTKIQGSAADITKKAMVLIESKFRKKFSYSPLSLSTTQSKRKLRISDIDSKSRGAFLILQLHDELLYEVHSNDLEQVVRIVKESMEHSYKLCVPLPVKIKVGTAWGNLEEYKFN